MTEVAVEVLLPKIGLTMQEGTIDEWLVPTGGAVSEGDALLRLATDKVDVDVEAEAGGLFHPVVQAGATLPAGALIGWLLAEGEALPVSGGPVPTQPVDAGTADAVSAAAGVPPVAASPNGSGGLNGSGGRLLASPNARRVAAGTGVDLTAVRGTGPGGRIVSEDVEEYLLAVPAQPPVVLSADPVTPTSPWSAGWRRNGASTSRTSSPPVRAGGSDGPTSTPSPRRPHRHRLGRRPARPPRRHSQGTSSR